MAIDSSIYQNIGRGVKSVADYETEAATSRQNKLAEIMDGMKMDEARRGIADDAAVRQAYQQSGGDQNKLLQNLQDGGQYKAGQALQKNMLDSQKLKDDSAKTQAETLDKTLGSFRSYVPQITTPEAAGQYTAAMYDHPILGKFAANFGSREDAVKRNMDAFAKDPRAWTTGAAGLTADKLLETMKGTRENVNVGDASMGQTRNYYGEIVPGQTTMTPIKQSADNAATLANSANTAQMADDRKRDELQGAQEAFSPDAIKNAASRYNIDGTLPPMGMGKAGSTGRAAILNEAAVQAGASGVSGDDQRIAQIGNKANTAALSKIQQSQTMVGAFEKNFTRNADIALEQSKLVDSTGVPLVNKWINSGKRSITGDAQLSAYDAVIKSTSNEYAKIVSGSMGNTAIAEGEIKKIESLLNSAQTPQQVEAVINMMKRETQNRMKGFEEEKSLLRNSMRSGQAAPIQAPASSAQQDGAISKSKSGKNIVMRNGSWEYQ